ncbi:MAG: TonB-dependent receptor plug domain-containing protein [Bacteroidales bacterium]
MKTRFLLLLIILLPLSEGLYSQKATKKITITGKVTDSSGKPVSGALILIDDQKTDVMTDIQGQYRIKVKPTAVKITAFTLYNGMSEVAINNRTSIDLVMPGSRSTSEQAKTNGDQINVGYGTVDKKDLTTSVGKIDGQNSKYASYTNIYDMIRGEVPGVQVSNNKITIHGVSSINSGTDPLFVVDGMVVNSIDDIRPQTVKSIEILKGSAASIYGSRGANGVILITLVGAEKKK